MAPKRRLSRSDWTEAAIGALADGGVSAVAIEPLAAQLGATKGSAYWHFPNRDALLEATLARWEQVATDEVIARAADGPDPKARLREVLNSAFSRVNAGAIETALLAAASDPVVGPVLERVTERRISYLNELFGQLGFSRSQARRRAIFGYAAFLGHAPLAGIAAAGFPGSPAATRVYLDEALQALMCSPS